MYNNYVHSMYVLHGRVFNEIIKPNGFIRLENRGERAHAGAPGNRSRGQKDPRKTHRQRDVELYIFFFIGPVGRPISNNIGGDKMRFLRVRKHVNTLYKICMSTYKILMH